MHSALFVAQKPEPFDTMASVRWPILVKELLHIAQQGQGVEMLAENVLLIPLEKNMALPAEAARVAASMPVISKTLYLADRPEWVFSSKKM